MHIAAHSHTRQGPPSRFSNQAREAVYSHLLKTASMVPITSQSDTLSVYTSLSRCTTQSSSGSSLYSGVSGSGDPTGAVADGGMGLLTLERALHDVEAMASLHQQRCLGIDMPTPLLNMPFPDWDLNVQRTQLFITLIPLLWEGRVPQIQPLAYIKASGATGLHRFKLCLVPHPPTDADLVQLFILSKIYSEHHLEAPFQRHVAVVSVRKSRLLQATQNPSALLDAPLSFELQCIALRNYVINLGCAAQTAIEFKHACAILKQKRMAVSESHAPDSTAILEEKKALWSAIRSNVFLRAGFEGELEKLQ